MSGDTSTGAAAGPEAPAPGTAAAARSPWQGARPGAADAAPTIARLSFASARLAAASAGAVNDRLSSAVTRTGGIPASAASPPSTPPGEGTLGQLVNLAFQLAQVVSYGAFRFIELLAGPLEQLIDPDTTIVDDVRLVLGPVAAGERVNGTFELENGADYDAEVSVLLSNPLASVRGHIPADRVVLTPSPASVPAGGKATIAVTVMVPTITESGHYLGIVRSDEVPDLLLLLEVDVT